MFSHLLITIAGHAQSEMVATIGGKITLNPELLLDAWPLRYDASVKDVSNTCNSFLITTTFSFRHFPLSFHRTVSSGIAFT